MKPTLFKMYYILCVIYCTVLFSCTRETKRDVKDDNHRLFTLLPAEQTGVNFTNTSIESPERNLGHYDYFYNGSGVAIGDFNNDGLPDLFFAGNDVTNKLYLNEGNFKFKDISKKAGIESEKWSTGVSLIDINQDGWLDIYVCSSGPYIQDSILANELYINNGDLTFTESAKQYGIDDASYSSQASFFDMDNDGDLDLFVMNHSLINYEKKIHKWHEVLSSQEENLQRKSSSTLYRNNGNNEFVDISKEAGIYRPGFGLGLAISDFDENGFLDIYVANDYFIPDFMFFNQGNGTYKEDIQSKVSHSSFYSMGCDAADFNNDGLVDLAVVDMTPSDHYRSKTLMESMDVDKFNYLVNAKNYTPQYMFNTLNLNRSKGNFSEIGQFSGVASTDWSWSSLLVDLDNDSWKDFVVTNGYKRDTKDRDWITELNERYENEGVTGEVVFDQLQKSKSTPIVNYIFRNEGNLTFKNVSKNWGFDKPSFSQGAAYGDLDNDGDLDMVINNLESNAFIYQNNTIEKKTNNYIQFTLSNGINSSDVLYSKIKVYANKQEQTLEYSFVRGYLSTMQPLAHFGLGNVEKIDKVEVKWPDGSMSIIEDVEINKKHHLDKSKLKYVLPNKEKSNFMFMDIANRIGISNFKHNENKYDDYKKEILLPHKQSTLGPCIAVSDVNGDGVDDFYVGGALGQPGKLYIQDLKKGFIPSFQKIFLKDGEYEDLGAKFFDMDNDGDLDLYVASGAGGEIGENIHLLQDRLYINDGNGIFSRSKNILPKMFESTMSIETYDWDDDGDLDLFVGGRTTPGKYPTAPSSFLLKNENGIFKNVTSSLAPELSKIGMVTSSCWSDINNDNRKDLIVVGEWMPITIFLNLPDGFKNVTELYGLSEEVGWWYSIEKGDFDNDGDEDFIVGNIGLNNKFQVKDDKPLHIFSNDFDNNGSLDIVLSKLYKGNLAPVRGKECSTQQMPFIKEKYPMFSTFAASSLEDIYGQENLNSSLHYKATIFASVYIENIEGKSLKIKELPAEAQLSPINDAIVLDFDKDGNLDIMVGGNMFNTEVETPAYDAGKGLYMKGNGDGTFTSYLKLDDSGVFMPKNVKDLELIYLLKEKRPAILVANNDSNLNLVAWTK